MTVEPYDLWKNYKLTKKPELKEEIIIHYISLVQKAAAKVAAYLPAHINKEDLQSHGIFGLIEAIDRYDLEQGVPFSTYAIKRIKGSIIDALRREDWVPLSVRRKARLVEQTYQKLEAEFGRSAKDQEVACELNISLDEFYEWLKNIQFISIISLEDTFSSADDGLVGAQIADENSPDPLSIMEKGMIQSIITKAVKELPEKEKTVISLFYYNDLSNKEIARLMELSDSRVSQLHTKAILRLRGKLSRVIKTLK